ncbi:hypothetical protein TNCV_982011 [Trichonephila clavipes]|nr:hypothetical protein TNCV_982011 [Trichonephila clavipes]
MGTLPSSRRGKCVTLFGGVRGPPRNSSACKQQQGRYTNYCCNPYGKAAPISNHCNMSDVTHHMRLLIIHRVTDSPKMIAKVARMFTKSQTWSPNMMPTFGSIARISSFPMNHRYNVKNSVV